MDCDACIPGKAHKLPGATSIISCADCIVGTFASEMGASACTLCAAYASSPTASDQITNCTCNAAYTGPHGGPCTACVAGQYKPVAGSAECESCRAGKYLGADTQCVDCVGNTYNNATGASTCVACPASSQATADKLSCVCNAGYTGPYTVCVACRAGKFKDVPGPAAGSAECESCGAGKYSSTASIKCDFCEAGKFCSAYGCSLCLDCAAGRYSTVLGAISPESCSDCPPGTYSSASGNPSLAFCVGYALARAREREKELYQELSITTQNALLPA